MRRPVRRQHAHALKATVRAFIQFYPVTDEYGEFSNFAPYPITIDGLRYPTSEHFSQAQKLV